MKSGLEVVRDIYNLINVPSVVNAISGDIYEFARPLNSDKEDVVIDLLGVGNDLFQEATVNVKIHVPNPQLEGVNGNDNTRPHLLRIKPIADLLMPLLDCRYVSSFNTEIFDNYLQRDDDGSWFYRFVIDYTSYNKKYKNI